MIDVCFSVKNKIRFPSKNRQKTGRIMSKNMARI